MKPNAGSGYCWGFCFPPFSFRFWGPWYGRVWGMGFPRHEDYLKMLEQYKADLEAMQRDIAEELKEVGQEIEKIKRG